MSIFRNPLGTHLDHTLVIKNVIWQSLDKIIRVSVNIFVLGYVARYLTTYGFGQINYIITIIAPLSILASLGLSPSIMKMTALDLPNQDGILNRALVIQVVSSSSIFLLVGITCISFPHWIGANPLYVFIFAVSILVKPIEIIKSRLEGQMIPFYSLVSENIGFILGSFIKIYFVITKAPLVYFIITYTGEIVISGLVLLYFFLSRNSSYIFRWILDTKSVEMIKNGLPLLVSALGVFIYMRVDQIMIKKFLGYESVGIYSAAMKFVEIWYAIPIFLSVAMGPVMMREFDENRTGKTNLLSNLFYLSSVVATVIAILVTLLSDRLVLLVFGPTFAEAAAILRISIWSFIFISIGQISANWYVAKGLNVLAMKRMLWSVVINILGNYFLIPIIGVKGAAISTLCSQAYSTWLGDFFDFKTRELFWEKTECIFLWPLKIINTVKGM